MLSLHGHQNNTCKSNRVTTLHYMLYSYRFAERIWYCWQCSSIFSPWGFHIIIVLCNIAMILRNSYYCPLVYALLITANHCTDLLSLLQHWVQRPLTRLPSLCCLSPRVLRLQGQPLTRDNTKLFVYNWKWRKTETTGDWNVHWRLSPMGRSVAKSCQRFV